MKKLRILPGAAGLIALTATIGFVDGQYKIEDESLSRSRITLVSTRAHTVTADTLPASLPDIKPDTPAYLVQIRRGKIFAEVMIDAITGQILLS